MENSKDAWRSTFCSICNEGPCMVRVHTVNGVAVNIEGNREVESLTELSKNHGRTCPKPFGMIQKLYNPSRIKAPLKRTNKQKGRGIDPEWVEISWDEALDTVAEKLKKIRDVDSRRLSISAGAQLMTHSGTWFALMDAFGPKQDLGSGGSIRCRMAEHIWGNLIHGAYRCLPDLNYCNYLLSLGDNTIVSGGAPENKLYSDARSRGMKAVVVDPVLSATAAKANEWVPIKPGTDSAFLLALIHAIIHESTAYDAEFLKTLTNSPYLVDNKGYFLRDKLSGKVLVWDPADLKAKPFDDGSITDFSLEGTYLVNGEEAKPAFQALKDHVRQYSPEWASSVTEIDAGVIRRVAREFTDNARIGSTIRIGGVTLPLRPVAIRLGRGISGAMRSYQCVLATHILEALVGSLEVVGGHCGGTGDPHRHWKGINPGPDGMLKLDTYPFTWPPVSYDGVETLLPFGKIYTGMHMKHLAYLNLVEPAKNFPVPAAPEALLRYRCNTLLSIGEPEIVGKALAKIQFIISIAYVMDEMTELADRIGFLKEYNEAVNSQLGLIGPFRLEPGKKYPWVEIVDRHCKSATGGTCDLQWFKQNGTIIKPISVEDQYDVHLKMVARKLRYPIPYMEQVRKTGEELSRNLARVGIDWWPTSEYVALPTYVSPILEEVPPEYDLYVTVARIPQFAFGSNVDMPWMKEVADHVFRQQFILMNSESARARKIKKGDEVWVESQVGKLKRKVKLSESIRPDTVLIAGQFGHWITPVSKDTGWVSEVTLTPIRHRWTDPVTGCMQGNLIKAKVYKA